MKTIILTSLLTLSSLAFGQEEMIKKFEKQELWESIIMTGPEGKSQFRGYLTERGTFRLNFDSSTIRTRFTLSVKNKDEWMKACAKWPYIDKTPTPGLELTISDNPFAKNYEYQLVKKTGEKLSTIWESENAPSSMEYRIRVEGNERSFSAAVQRGGYSEYIQRTEDELNRQFSSQMSSYLRNEAIRFDLSKMTDVGCDYTMKFLDIIVEVSFKAEVQRILRNQWIKKTELESLHEEISTQKSRDLEIYQAGLKIGQAFQKANLEIDLFRNNRDHKLLDALFKSEKDSFALRPKAELENKYFQSAEIKVPKDWNEEISVGIQKLELDIKERN